MWPLLPAHKTQGCPEGLIPLWIQLGISPFSLEQEGGKGQGGFGIDQQQQEGQPGEVDEDDAFSGATKKKKARQSQGNKKLLYLLKAFRYI